MKNSLQKALRQKSRKKDNNLQELFPFWSSFSLKVHTVGLKLANVQEKNKQEKNYIDLSGPQQGMYWKRMMLQQNYAFIKTYF